MGRTEHMVSRLEQQRDQQHHYRHVSQYIISKLLVYLSGVDLGVYGVLVTGQIVFIILGILTIAIGSIRASRTIHNNMLANILRSPLAFFDTTPIGRIVNRFSKVRHGSTVATSLSLSGYVHYR